MAAAVVFNNKVFGYDNTFQTATSITFNPWFPPEGPDISFLEPNFRSTPSSIADVSAISSSIVDLSFMLFGLRKLVTGGLNSQGLLDYYVPIINYGTTCALAFGICSDAAQRTIMPCCSNKTNMPRLCTTIKNGLSYANSIKGPFYYYLVNSWASSMINTPSCHSVHNFFGSNIQRKLLDAATNYPSLYNDSPENINKIYYYLNKLFNKLNIDATYERMCPLSFGTQPALDCGVKIITNIVLSGNYNIPTNSPLAGELEEFITITDKGESIEITVDPAKIGNELAGGKKYKTSVKKTSKKIRKTRSKRNTKKLRK